MNMRVTQNMMTRNYLRNMNNNLARLSKAQERMLGQKYAKGSENVADTTRALRLRQNIFKNETYITNIRDAEARIASAESNINSISEVLVKAREKLIGKGASDGTAAQRDTIAAELDSLRDQILQFANAQYADSYLFGGTENGRAPFAVGGDGRLTYQDIPVDDIYKHDPDDGRYYYTLPDNTEAVVPETKDQFIDIGLGITVTGSQIDAKSAFKVTFSGLDLLCVGKDDKGNSQNLFNLLKDAADLFRGAGDGPLSDADRERLESMSGRMKESIEDLQLNLTDLGTRSTFLEMSTQRIESDIFNLTELQQKLEVSDTAEESINWKVYSALMMATYQFGSQVIPVSLMDFIK